MCLSGVRDIFTTNVRNVFFFIGFYEDFGVLGLLGFVMTLLFCFNFRNVNE